MAQVIECLPHKLKSQFKSQYTPSKKLTYFKEKEVNLYLTHIKKWIKEERIFFFNGTGA
jgi:hypothetical protein